MDESGIVCISTLSWLKGHSRYSQIQAEAAYRTSGVYLLSWCRDSICGGITSIATTTAIMITFSTFPFLLFGSWQYLLLYPLLLCLLEAFLFGGVLVRPGRVVVPSCLGAMKEPWLPSHFKRLNRLCCPVLAWMQDCTFLQHARHISPQRDVILLRHVSTMIV